MTVKKYQIKLHPNISKKFLQADKKDLTNATVESVFAFGKKQPTAHKILTAKEYIL